MAIVPTTLERHSMTDHDRSSRPELAAGPARMTDHAKKAVRVPVGGRRVSDEDVRPTDPRGRHATNEEAAPHGDLSNYDLLCRFRSGGDERAFAELYRRHKAEVYTYCLRMMSGDRDAANDLFQEVFIKAFEKADQFRVGTNVTGWIYMIARNLCLNAIRDRRPNDALDAHPMLASRDRSLAPEYDEEQHFLRQKLEEALQALPLEFREPFMLREFDGFTYSEIAQMTGATLSVTKVRIYRAKQKMRELLGPYIGP